MRKQVILLLFVLLFTALPASAQATVVQPISISPLDGGAPGTFLISGCGSSLYATGNGVVVNFTVTPGCLVSISDTSGLLLGPNATWTSFTACTTSCTLLSFGYYHGVKVELSAVPAIEPTVSYLFRGTSQAARVLGNTLLLVPNGTAISFQNSNTPLAGQEYVTRDPTYVISGPVNITQRYQLQDEVVVSYIGTDGSIVPVQRLFGTQFGAVVDFQFNQSSLFNTVYLDNGSYWATLPSIQVPGNVWRLDGPYGGVISAPTSLNFTYAHEYTIEFNFSAPPAFAPTISYVSGGQDQNATLTPLTPYEIDSGTMWSIGPYTANGTQYAPMVPQGTATGPANITLGFTPQYLLRIAAANVTEGRVSDSSLWVPANTTVFVTAYPSNGFSFLRWVSTGGAVVSDPQYPTAQVTLNSPGTVTAYFTANSTVNYALYGVLVMMLVAVGVLYYITQVRRPKGLEPEPKPSQ